MLINCAFTIERSKLKETLMYDVLSLKLCHFYFLGHTWIWDHDAHLARHATPLLIAKRSSLSHMLNTSNLEVYLSKKKKHLMLKCTYQNRMLTITIESTHLKLN